MFGEWPPNLFQLPNRNVGITVRRILQKTDSGKFRYLSLRTEPRSLGKKHNLVTWYICFNWSVHTWVLHDYARWGITNLSSTIVSFRYWWPIILNISLVFLKSGQISHLFYIQASDNGKYPLSIDVSQWVCIKSSNFYAASGDNSNTIS